MSKPKKNVRNKARDMLGDYYLANRQVEKENRERQEARKAWSSSEIFLLVIIVLGLIALAVKYLILE